MFNRHLHSELRRISRETDSIFGIQMTLEMGCYFAFIAAVSKEIFRIMYEKSFMNDNILYVIIIVLWILICIFRLFLINYICERVSTKVAMSYRKKFFSALI